MKQRQRPAYSLCVFAMLLAMMLPAIAAAAPADVIWARRSTAPITLDGVLNEAAWAKAESVTVIYGVDAGVPGSGWKPEAGAPFASDSTDATLKFLVVGNQLYMAASVRDSSVGGSADWNRFDGLLMSLKDHLASGAPKPPNEYFYCWWYPLLTNPRPAGEGPRFKGRWAQDSTTVPRDSTQIANWDAVTVIHGQSNNDAVIDQGYTVEMRFNLTAMGYNVTQPAGDTVEWNIAIWDSDWNWPYNALKFQTNRVWWQSPWGGDMWYSEVKIRARPDVTTSSGALPAVGHEFAVPEVSNPAPIVNGLLTDAAWSNPAVYTFDIRWDDAALRATYPGIGPYRAGQYMTAVNGGTPKVVDPPDATVKMFYKGTDLYLGFDVRDEVVQYHPSFDRYDGFLVTVTDKAARTPDNVLKTYRMTFQVAQNGTATAQDDLAAFVAGGTASVALALKPGTVVDTTGAVPDQGYTAEMRLSLPAMGYPVGLGDRILWIGVNHLDGDSFDIAEDCYGTRTWWFREYPGNCCPGHGLLAPLTAVSVDPLADAPGVFFARSFPNPSASQILQFSLPQSGRVTMELYDVSGRLVERRDLGVHDAGVWQTPIDGTDRTSGVYFYQLKLVDPQSESLRATVRGKIVLLN